MAEHLDRGLGKVFFFFFFFFFRKSEYARLSGKDRRFIKGQITLSSCLFGPEVAVTFKPVR